MTEEQFEKYKKKFNSKEALIVGLTYKVTELTEKLEKINAIVWKTEHKFKDFEKIKSIIME